MQKLHSGAVDGKEMGWNDHCLDLCVAPGI